MKCKKVKDEIIIKLDTQGTTRQREIKKKKIWSKMNKLRVMNLEELLPLKKRLQMPYLQTSHRQANRNRKET